MILKVKRTLFYAVLILIWIYGFYLRAGFLLETGGDSAIYIRAIEEFYTAVNPYIAGIETYKNISDVGGHGFSYLPGFLYLFGPLYLIHLVSGISFAILWKIPILLADFLICLLLTRYFKSENKFAMLVANFIWFVNPYIFLRSGYTYTDPIPVFFLFLSLLYLKKDSVLTSALFVISMFFKSIGLILLPVYLVITKNKKEFLITAAVLSIFLSLPFITSVTDLLTFITGSFLVHSQRAMQGRPFLFYISFFYEIEFFRLIPLRVYTSLATFGSMVLVLLAYFLLKIKNKYFLTTLAFINFYIFTPVLNRTYLLWFIPFFLIGMWEISQKKRYFYIATACFYVFYFLYLKEWKDGLHILFPVITE